MVSSLDFVDIRKEIGGVAISEIATSFGTPTYVYDAAIIQQRIADLKAFDAIRFAQKANSNIAVLSLARKCGAVVDAVSAGEIHRALKAGYTPGQAKQEIVYTADIFDREALAAVLKYDIHCNMGSPDMIEQYGQVAPGKPITLRVNPGFGHGHSQKTNTGGPQSKHGIWHEQIDECLKLAAKYNLTISGLHMHIGSGSDFEHLSQVCEAMKRIALKVGKSLTSISAGGGLPTPYRPTDKYVDISRYYQLWNGVRDELSATFGHKLHLEIEPGRYLVAESGFLIAEIRAVKQMGENKFYLVDAGFNNLARPILYGAYHPMSICPVGHDASAKNSVIVGGPLCESGDIFTQQDGGYVSARELPAARIGDYLVIERAGAYGFVMASNYNSKPLAAEVLIQDGKAHLIRRRQTYDDLTNLESIPN